MRIAYVLFDPGIPIGGTKGASIHVREFCNSVANQGHEVHLLASNVVGDVPAGVTIHRIELNLTSKSDNGKIAAAGIYCEATRKILAQIKPDLIYERLSMFFPYGKLLADELGVQRLLEINAPIVDERITHFGVSEIDRAYRAERDAISGSDVIVVSDALVD